MRKSTLQLVGHNLNNNRVENDFYPTPPYATNALLDREKFIGNIWECACGDGAISKLLISEGYDVYSSDLIDRGFGVQHDFLQTNKKFDNIVTNPPFNLATEFTIHGLKSINNKMALLCKLSFLEGKKRASTIFYQDKLKKVLVFSRRLGFQRNDKKGGLMAFAWFIFDVNYNAKPTIDWI
tara:strand:- start:173 stop:715 length:543 start_codon:yes stop_codon:yes gene_type:complete